MNKISVSHPTSNQNNREVVRGLKKAGMLRTFYTSIAVFPNDFFDRLSKFRPFSDLVRRKFSSDLRYITKAWSNKELMRMVAKKMRLNFLTKHEVGALSVDAIYHSLDKKVAKNLRKDSNLGLDAIYAYEDGAYYSFVEAKKRGIKCIYDLPIAYWETSKRLLKEEAERLPDWAETIRSGLSDSEEKLKRKKNELSLADVVVVPSYFVRDSLPQWAKDKKIIMTPFGSPNNFKRKVFNIDNKSPLKVLFVGSMTQRKGLGDLFEAIKMIDKSRVELIVLGSLAAPMEFYKSQLNNFTYEKGRPHYQVLELMRSCDVFCLPSLVEGRALVMQEAMSQGLPMIITPNTGGEDLIIEGQTGFLIPIRSPELIAEKINWFLENRLQIADMGKKAQEHAQDYTWKKYSDNIVNVLANI